MVAVASRGALGRTGVFGGARGGTRKVVSPWGRPVAKRGGTRGSSPRGSSHSKTTPDPSLKGMRYKANDPLVWPLENPAQRSDLEFDKTTQAKADFNNRMTNQAFKRGGYAG